MADRAVVASTSRYDNKVVFVLCKAAQNCAGGRSIGGGGGGVGSRGRDVGGSGGGVGGGCGGGLAAVASAGNPASSSGAGR